MLQKLRVTFAHKLQAKLQAFIKNRPPNFSVGSHYLKRWHIIPRNRFFNIYYHNFQSSDVDIALHDHMYCWFSVLLEGEYKEHTLNGVFHRKSGDLKFRLPKTLHWIELIEENEKPKECWSLFITGPRIRDWGFQVGPVVRNWLGFKTRKGWVDHETFVHIFRKELVEKHKL